MSDGIRVRVTVEFLDEPSARPIVLDDYQAIVTREAGIVETPSERWGSINRSHNGQMRARLLLWKGCQSFSDFEAVTRIR